MPVPKSVDQDFQLLPAFVVISEFRSLKFARGVVLLCLVYCLQCRAKLLRVLFIPSDKNILMKVEKQNYAIFHVEKEGDSSKSCLTPIEQFICYNKVGTSTF